MPTIEHTTTNALEVRDIVESASRRIAPTWPLDQWIAVNPYWGFISDPVRVAASHIESYSGSRMLMPRSFYRDQWNKGALRTEHLNEALEQSDSNLTMDDLRRALEEDEAPSVPRVSLATRLVDAHRDLLHGMSLTDFVTHNISQHCASYFDHVQSSWKTQHKTNLYQSWLYNARIDKRPWLLMGIHGMHNYASSLPHEPLALIAAALQELLIPREQWEDYFTAILMSMNGWASWCSYERWQARLSQRADDHIVQLLAIRMAWDHFIYLHLFDAETHSAWHQAWAQTASPREHDAPRNAIGWIFQEALEIAYQHELCDSLRTIQPSSARSASSRTAVQAVFCIDVRSEVFRRALEACTPEIQTLGFAGFFGLPIAYTPLGTATVRPQLPGLLAPSLRVSDTTGSSKTDEQMERARKRSLDRASAWKSFRSSAISMFTFVESCGFFFAGALLQRTLPRFAQRSWATHTARRTRQQLRPCLLPEEQDSRSSIDSRCDLVARILTTMSLTRDFGRILLLVGHGSATSNNPLAAGLNCGACGGHTGEVNARLLADLLNDRSIRDGLLHRGIVMPPTTYVLAALHNTTTDEVTLFDADRTPPTHVADRVRLQEWLKQAGHRARCERVPSVGIPERIIRSEQSLLQQFQARSRDWSQVRPEWGLVNNAAFLIAPRSRSYGHNLHGRVFLHEYQSTLDPTGTVLEAMMTAPMLVTNWINMQYYASTVDNQLYGSGNKVLHNVVGGRLGVFEGNGGDLRIGLPLQSLHDGHQLRHIPLRLSVFIEAPQHAIADVMRKHEVVRNLIGNAWIHLFQITPGTNSITRYRNGIWIPTEAADFIGKEPVTSITEDTYA